MNNLRVIVFIAIIIGIGGLWYFIWPGYSLSFNNQDIILSADQEAHKRKPLDPGGIVIPNSNSLIYEKLNPTGTSESNISLLSEPEEPMDLGFKSNLENIVVYDSIDDILANIDLNGNNQERQTENSARNLPDQVNSTNEESRKENGSISKLKIITQETNHKLHNLNNHALADSGYKIQLSSSWSEKEAKNEWQKIQLRHIKYLKTAQLIIEKVKVDNDRIIYLIMAGSYSSLNQAKLICKKLIESKQNCIITR